MYIQTFKNTTGGQFSMLPLIQNPTQLTHLYLAALHINDDPNNINLNDDNPNSTVWNTMWNEAAQVQAQGVKVMFMMGGAAAGSYPRLCGGSKGTAVNMTYYMPLYYTIKYHNIDGLNLDIEEQVVYQCPLALLQQLNKDFGPNFILTMSPVASELQPSGSGLGGFSYKTLDSKATASSKPAGKLINWFNAQFYNGWGDASSTSGYTSIIKNGYAANRVAMGILDSPNDGGSGFYPIATYQKTIKSLRSTYGTSFGDVVGWEYWDAGIKDNDTYPYQWTQTIGTASFNKRDVEDEEEDAELVERQIPSLTPAGDPTSYGPSPWPALASKLVGAGVLQIAAVRALNISNGDLHGALGVLGLPTNLLGG
ncbi:glycoside hydrolase family 18 [Lecanosticta acicola]|uniref:Glycoside hydrolase family 18, partial n=1 Tax=Lecanosticta acicola TaxID=111012 RepID=A0AAI8YUV0_9PEZI|nr:glycoside hydrolase family 18 [Lecanosticta acicola]